MKTDKILSKKELSQTFEIGPVKLVINRLRTRYRKSHNPKGSDFVRRRRWNAKSKEVFLYH